MSDLYNTILLVCGICSVTMIILVIIGTIKGIIESKEKYGKSIKCPYCKTRIKARKKKCPYCEKEIPK